MPRHTTSIGSGLRAREAAPMYDGSGLRAREAPATYADSVGVVSGAGISTSGGTGTKMGASRNAWVTHVKRYAHRHGISYGEALCKAKSSYRS